MLNKIPATILFLLVIPSLLFAQEKSPNDFPVISYRNLDVKEFNVQITAAEKRREEWAFNPLSLAMRFHKVSDVRFVNIKQKSDRTECPLKSIITIVEEGFLDDQMRGRWTEFHLERKNCPVAWSVKELRQAYLCGTEGSKEVFLKELCPETRSGKVTDVWVEMTPASAGVPCDYFPYTFNVKFKISVNGPTNVAFQRIRSDGVVAPVEEIVFSEAGSKEFYDYYRVREPGDYWFRVEIIRPNKISGKASSKVICHEKNGSSERKAILDALREGCPATEIVFVFNYLKVKDNWAWIETNPQSPDGKNKLEPFNALLHKEKGKWIIKKVQPCCGDCADDPECADIKRYYKKLMREFPSAPRDIFPK